MAHVFQNESLEASTDAAHSDADLARFPINLRRPQPTRDSLVGRIFNNRFRVHSLIARGGMGRVYRAMQVPLGRMVALKVLHAPGSTVRAADFHRRFLLEAAIAAKLSHPNTVTVYDFGQSDDGIYYLAMEFLQGRSLRSELSQTRFTPQRAVRVAQQMAAALQEAHGLGAVHRDLKPANVFLLQRDDTADFVKVLDFGLVKQMNSKAQDDVVTRPGRFLGSPGYMAPEQIRGQPVDTRCDIYALGVLLYEMLSGQPPFVRTGPLETMMAHVHDPVPRLGLSHSELRLPARLEELVHTCLAKCPEDRYRSVTAVLGILNELAGTLIAAGPSTQVSYRRPTPVRLQDEEQSGWSVVSTTGVLALPRLATSQSPAETWAVSTQLGPTLALDDAAAPAPTLPKGGPHRLAPKKNTAVRAAGLTQALASGAAGVHPARWAWLALAVAIAVVSYPYSSQQFHAWQERRRAPYQIHLTSAPLGAAVYVEDTLLCEHTPCAVSWDWRDDPHSPAMVTLRFVLPGHADFVASRRLSGRQLRVHARL